MNQKNTMSKLPNGIRVISYELGSYPLQVYLLHFLLSGKRYSQDRTGAINASSSIAFDHSDCHPMPAGSQA
jgi:hypothetical protein